MDDIDVAPSTPPDPPASAATEPDVAPAHGEESVPDTVAAPRNDQPFPTCRLGNLHLARITRAEAIGWILDQSRKERSCVVVTSNVFHLMLAERDAEFARVTATCELNVADGWPLVVASRLLRTPAPERIAGVDVVEGLLRAPMRLRVAILGGAPGVAELLADRFRHEHDIVFVDPLPMGEWQADEYQERMRSTIAEARPNLVLIGIGAPRQELLSDSLRGLVSGPDYRLRADRRRARWGPAAGTEVPAGSRAGMVFSNGDGAETTRWPVPDGRRGIHRGSDPRAAPESPTEYATLR